MTDEPRDWETLRSDAIRAARRVAGDDDLAERVADAVLSVVDEETVRALCEEHIRNTMIRSMDFRNGASLEVQPARDMIAYWVGAARVLLDGAENYSETTCEFGIPEDPQRYSFVVQKVGKVTPHEARRKAEAERDQLRAEVAASLRRVAAGRREYAATGCKDADHGDRELLAAEAHEVSAEIAENPARLLDLIPSWRWTAEEAASVLPGSS